MAGDFRKLLKEAKKLNFIYEGVTGTNHHRFRHAGTGKKVIAAQTPSCPYAWRNALRDMQKIVKGEW